MAYANVTLFVRDGLRTGIDIEVDDNHLAFERRHDSLFNPPTWEEISLLLQSKDIGGVGPDDDKVSFPDTRIVRQSQGGAVPKLVSAYGEVPEWLDRDSGVMRLTQREIRESGLAMEKYSKERTSKIHEYVSKRLAGLSNEKLVRQETSRVSKLVNHMYFDIRKENEAELERKIVEEYGSLEAYRSAEEKLVEERKRRHQLERRFRAKEVALNWRESHRNDPNKEGRARHNRQLFCFYHNIEPDQYEIWYERRKNMKRKEQYDRSKKRREKLRRKQRSSDNGVSVDVATYVAIANANSRRIEQRHAAMLAENGLVSI